MTVTKETFKAYIDILSTNGIDGDDLLRLVDEIKEGEWDRCVAFSLDNDNDPFNDINWVGHPMHY